MAPCYVIDFTVGWSFGEPQARSLFSEPDRLALKTISAYRFANESETEGIACSDNCCRRDRRIATEWVIRALMLRGAIAAITTHDLALTEIANNGLPGKNVCFEDSGAHSVFSPPYPATIFLPLPRPVLADL